MLDELNCVRFVPNLNFSVSFNTGRKACRGTMLSSHFASSNDISDAIFASHNIC